jgi:hypothetical protein
MSVAEQNKRMPKLRLPRVDTLTLSSALVVAGLAAVVYGVALIYLPLAVIAAGVFTALLGVGRMRA